MAENYEFAKPEVAVSCLYPRGDGSLTVSSLSFIWDFRHSYVLKLS